MKSVRSIRRIDWERNVPATMQAPTPPTSFATARLLPLPMTYKAIAAQPILVARRYWSVSWAMKSRPLAVCFANGERPRAGEILFPDYPTISAFAHAASGSE